MKRTPTVYASCIELVFSSMLQGLRILYATHIHDGLLEDHVLSQCLRLCTYVLYEASELPASLDIHTSQVRCLRIATTASKLQRHCGVFFPINKRMEGEKRTFGFERTVDFRCYSTCTVISNYSTAQEPNPNFSVLSLQKMSDALTKGYPHP